MSLAIKIPEVGESITEVTVATWLKKDGDYVETDEIIAELESDKATFELPAEAAGVLRIKAQEGDILEIGGLLAEIDTDAKGNGAPAPSAEATEVKEEAAAPVAEPSKTGEVHEMKVPTVGESITEVTVGSWIKNDGDFVELDEEIAEIESDKATFELPGTNTKPSNYNATATPEEALNTWTKLQQKELHQEMLMAFGYGDGGGGPTREMLENIREMRQFPATPQMRHGRAVDFFRSLETNSGDRLPTWDGELYLEYHRGTYTTQSRNKRASRKSEYLLHDAEFLAVAARLLNHQYLYPAARLREAWELVCLNQVENTLMVKPGNYIPGLTDILFEGA